MLPSIKSELSVTGHSIGNQSMPWSAHTFRNSVILLVKHIIRLTSRASFYLRRNLPPQTLFAWDDDSAALRNSSDTSWLDGLRGVAALQVYFFHFFGRYAQTSRSYGSTPEDRYLHQLPWIRSIWCSGSGAVSTFFVISGYVITYKSFLRLRRSSGPDDELYRSLCSSLFRRGFRLYLPVLLLALPTFFLVATGLIDLSRGFLYPGTVKDTFFQQLGHFLEVTDQHINPFRYESTLYAYVPISWTIPIEYYGSLVCYLMVMFVSRIDTFRIRCFFLSGMALYALHRGSWFVGNFLTGMQIADYTIEQKSKPTAPGNLHRGIHDTCYFMAFLFGLYIAGMPPQPKPSESDHTVNPGYEILYRLHPPSALFHFQDDTRWYWTWSGNLTVLGISQVPWLQSIFDSKFCQWLGKLSFGLYLIHLLVIEIFSRHLKAIAGFFFGSHKSLICLFEFAVEAPVIFILAGVVERYMDRPSVAFAKRLEQWAFRERRGQAVGTAIPVIDDDDSLPRAVP